MFLVGNDQSEAVTSDTPVAELDMTLSDLYVSGTFSYDVAKGSFIYIRYYNEGAVDMTVDSISTTYGTGDTAGLTLISNGSVMGIIDKVAAGTVTMPVSFVNAGGEFDFTITLNVLDTSSSENNLYHDTISLPANVFVQNTDYYAEIGTTVSIAEADVGITTDRFIPVSVTAGYGLSVSGSPAVLSGTITVAGTITVQLEERVTSDQLANTYTVSIHAIDPNHADVRMIGGETWTYTPTTDMVSVLSLSGTATSWVSLSEGGVVSGTAPTDTSVGQTYDLTITASTSDPNQNATQTVTFTVDPQITMLAPATYTVEYGTGVDDILGSNFLGGGRSIYSITGGTATGFAVDAVNGAVEWINPTSGTVIFTATSPYTYTSGATNTASATMDVTVTETGVLTVSASGTLYLVTGKTVPNTPAEAVTLNHNDVGEGTYTWAVVGTNTSGVTVASDGTLGGTPGNVGTYAVTVRCTSVVDGTTQTADATLNIIIVQVLAFTSTPSQGIVQ